MQEPGKYYSYKPVLRNNERLSSCQPENGWENFGEKTGNEH